LFHQTARPRSTLRAVWQAVESSGNVDQVKLKKDIYDTVNRLKGRIDGKLASVSVIVPPPEQLLFDEPLEEKKTCPKVVEARPHFPEPALRVYARDLADHALKHVPKLSGCLSIEDIRAFQSLHRDHL
jgi:hypothetical protein